MKPLSTNYSRSWSWPWFPELGLLFYQNTKLHLRFWYFIQFTVTVIWYPSVVFRCLCTVCVWNVVGTCSSQAPASICHHISITRHGIRDTLPQLTAVGGQWYFGKDPPTSEWRLALFLPVFSPRLIYNKLETEYANKLTYNILSKTFHGSVCGI